MAQPASPLPTQPPLSFTKPGLAGLQELTNLNDISRLLHEMLAKERSVNAELEGLLSKRSTLEGSLVTLQSSTAEVRGPLPTIEHTVADLFCAAHPCRRAFAYAPCICKAVDCHVTNAVRRTET